MNVLDIARLQFATTTIIHFLFVLLTLGFVTLLVFMQTMWAVTNKPAWERHTKFWGRLYVINYFLGIATGLVVELQFGLAWSGLSDKLGNVFGAPLAIETIVAFFLESTFLGLWIFGWGRFNKWVHTVLLWLVAITAYLSVFWVMVANSYLQNPVDGFAAMLTNSALVTALPHTVLGALMTGGFVMAGISAWHLIKQTSEVDFFRTSLRLGVVVSFVSTFFTIGSGFAQFEPVRQTQPLKLGDNAAKKAELAELTAKFGPGDYDIPVYANIGLGLMILLAMGLLLVGAFIPLLYRDRIIKWRFPLIVLILAIPFPFLAATFGWMFREGGRQPWLVYGVLKTQDALTPGLSFGGMLTSFIVFTVVLLGLAITNWTLIARTARRGPTGEFL